MKKILIVLLSLAGISSYAQLIDDLALYNQRELHGTPRYIGLGGAFTALGNDLSSIHLNPAGASVYRFNNLGITFGLQTTNTNALLNDPGQELQTSDFNFLFENIGLVMKFDIGGSSDWSELSFGVTYNKLADFNNQSTALGTRGDSANLTLGQYWFIEANGFDENELSQQGLIEELAALQAGILLTDTNGIVVDYGYYVPNSSDITYRRQETGSLNEAAITLGGQYKNNFYYGISFGFPTLTYTMSDQVTEAGLLDSAAPFDVSSYTLNRYVEMYGNGFNIKVGAIYKPAQWFRAGFSYESPTWYTVNQFYEVDVTSRINDGPGFASDIFTTGEYSYRYSTPSIYRIGTAYIIGKSALISVDYEYSNLTQSNTYVGRNSFNVIESNIEQSDDNYTGVVQGISTVRFGGEYRIGPVSLRGGYNLRQSQFRDEASYTSDISTWSTGLGFRGKQFTIDLAFAQTSFSQTYVVHPFLDNNGINATSDFIRNNFTLGFTYRF